MLRSNPRTVLSSSGQSATVLSTSGLVCRCNVFIQHGARILAYWNLDPSGRDFLLSDTRSFD